MRALSYTVNDEWAAAAADRARHRRHHHRPRRPVQPGCAESRAARARWQRPSMMQSMSWIPASRPCCWPPCSAAPRFAQERRRSRRSPRVAELRAQLDAHSHVGREQRRRARAARAASTPSARRPRSSSPRAPGSSTTSTRAWANWATRRPAGAPPEDPDITAPARRPAEGTQRARCRHPPGAPAVTVDAQQRGSELLAKRRALFEAQLTERAPSPLGREFWDDISDAWPADVDRLAQLWRDELRAGVDIALRAGAPHAVLASLALALLLALLGNWAAERGLARLAARMLPAGRLRRSLLVIAIVARQRAAGRRWRRRACSPRSTPRHPGDRRAASWRQAVVQSDHLHRLRGRPRPRAAVQPAGRRGGCRRSPTRWRGGSRPSPGSRR